MISNIDNLQKFLEVNMKKCIDNFKVNINKIYIGRISSNILDSIMVEYYGMLTPVSQLTNSVVDRPQTLVITVFDMNMIKPIEKAIFAANLGLTPVSRKNVIRVTLPVLTQDRRLTLIKMVRSESEKSKISIRNIRRIANDKVKILLKNKEINEDDERYFQDKIQNLTNVWIAKINLILQEKESELMVF